MSVIGVRNHAMGTANIQIHFKGLRKIIDVDFLLLDDAIPSLLLMRDMVKNGLDISLLKRHVSYGGRTHMLQMKNYFVIHTWEPEEIPFALYTEAELRSIHRNFGHPSIKSKEGLMCREIGGETDEESLRMIR